MNMQNNDEMNTIVQTYYQNETVELIYDDEKLNKWNELIDNLQLEGQTYTKVKDKSPIPFMFMKKSLENVFETLCPVKVKIKRYSLTPIPIEILELIELANRENYFHEIEIWYDDKKPDPVAVGIIYTHWELLDASGNQIKGSLLKHEAEKLQAETPGRTEVKVQYSWYQNRYLLGRWGDVNKPLNVLTEEAIERYAGSEKIRLEKELVRIKREIEDLNVNIHERFN